MYTTFSRFPRALRRAVIAVTLLLAGAPPQARAATLPTGFTESVFGSGLSNPTAMQFAPDGRLFVAQQGGALRVIQNGVLLPTPFVTLTVDAGGERGLLGVAFDPNFGVNQYVYVYYTVPGGGGVTVHNRVSRFTANGNVAVAGSELPIIELDNLSGATNHNGGAIDFGPDGKLYVAVGDNANSSYPQSLSTRHGKMLRYNADGSIPIDNPFYGTATGANRAIWTLGLRNPFTFAQNPGGNPAMLINDVGAGTWEEINAATAGVNFGWPTTEGDFNPATYPAFTRPRFAYDHAGGACAITGGAFYSPATATFPGQYTGMYFYADFCANWIRVIDPTLVRPWTTPTATPFQTPQTFATNVNGPVDLKVGNDGALYYLARGAGTVYRVQYGNSAPGISLHPANRTVAVGQSATFTVAASGSTPFTYQWQRNNVNIPGATSASYTLGNAQPSDSGARFRVNVANGFGNLYSNEATLTVTSNVAPVATITAPATSLRYTGGLTVAFAGTGSDPDGPTSLPAAAFTWRVDFHHDTHLHPFLPATSGIASGTFVIPTTGETAANVWYRIHLTVTDGGGLTHTVQRDVLPQVVRLTLAASPAVLQVRLDGQPVPSPTAFDSVVGVQRTIDAPAQTVGGVSYVFSNWSDGGAASHAILTPAVATTYTASFAAGGGPPTGVTLTPSVPKPQPAGTPVVWTATPQGGTAPVLYRFWIQPWGQSWTVVQDWSAAATFAWTPAQAGGYNVSVQARRSTSADTEASVLVDYVVSTGGSGGGGGGPVTSVSVTPSVPKPQPAGTTVVWTATPQGGTAPILYRFWIQPWGQAWTVAQDWSAAATFAWTPTLAGGYNVSVQARRSASTATEAEVLVDYLVSTGSGGGGGGALTSVSLTPSLQPAQPVGTVITWTAAPQGASSGVEYRFWVQPWSSGVWTVMRDWSATTTFGWTPTAAGGYNVAVEARQSTTGASAQTAVGYGIRTP